MKRPRIAALALWAGMLFCVAGCATERYLTEEQDAQMRAFCEPLGCEILQRPAWEQIETILRALGLSSS